MKTFATLVATVVLVCLAAGPASTAERVALIVGNGTYDAVAPLRNPENDARDIAAALGRLDFDVTLHINLDGRSINRALRDFARRADGAEMAVLYFAGHGLEIDRRNYLLPVDAQIETSRDVVYEAVEMGQFLNAVSGARSLRLLLLDACRNNPFMTRMADASSRSIGLGLGRIEPPGGIVVGYAAKGGTVAFDGDGRNSPYAAALLMHIEEPGLEIGKLFRRVRDTVYSTTAGQQEPFTYGSLPAKDIYLAAQRPQGPTEAQMLQDFARAVIINTIEGWTEFLDRFTSTGLNPDILRRARQKRAALKRPATASAPPATEADAASPLIRACDGLAADPLDPQRPDGVPGIALADIDVSAAKTACTLAVSGHPGHGRSLFQLGRVLAASGTESPIRHWEASAASGYVAAQVALGELFTHRDYAKTFGERGMDLLRAATQGGSARAPRLLADLRARDIFGRTSVDSPGLELYRIAAERGDIPGKYEAGFRLLSGSLSSAEDRALGLRYLDEAARAGHQPSQLRLLNYYLAGPDADIAKSVEMAAMAAEDGSVYALKFLVREYKDGTRFGPDAGKAFQWARKGADLGQSGLMVEAGYALETGNGVARNPGEAARYYLRALKAYNTAPIARAGGEWDRDTAREMQQLLRREERSRFTGPIDGIVGAGTRAAMLRLCNCSRPARTIRFADIYQ